ncbi:DUF6265 family protein [Marinicella sediminis]|uniref:DUF6265 family protein n=1 Tax=Marinicella sediminis TaxID=1792834 RepID=A0ABV7JD72_9GAMM|nr:DUF6265 family protein [Marinicella sediminis]
MMKILLTWLLLILSTSLMAQSKKTAHTYRLDDPNKRPPAKIQQVAWLAGSWSGTAFGQQFEEVWNPPSAGSMVGMFKLYDENKGVNFYELMLLVEQEESLSLLVKHFSADFVSWESKEEHINFKLVAIEDQAIHFSGLSFYRTGADTMDVYLAMRMKDETVREEKMLFHRQRP